MTKKGTDSGDALTHFDFMRGVAACAVALGHVRGLYFLDYEKVPNPNPLLKALYLATGLGHQSVVVFFVLSGFFVGTSVLSARTRWSWSHYLLRRFTRLYVVLIPALLVTALLDRTGMAVFGAEGVYAGKIDAPYFSLQNVSDTGSLGSFVGNLFYLEEIFVRPFGSNGPLWSLSYEFWAYLLFPLLVQAATPRVPIAARLLYATVAGVLLYFGGERLRFYFPLWLAGALIAGTWQKVRVQGRVTGITLRMASLGMFLFILLLARLRFFGHQDRDDIALALATSALVFTLLVTARTETTESSLRRAYKRSAAILASFSYTLYLIHYPALVFAYAALIGGPVRWVPDAKHLGIGAVLAFGVIWLFAYPLARVTEAHTEKVRRWFGQALRIELRRPSAAEAGPAGN